DPNQDGPEPAAAVPVSLWGAGSAHDRGRQLDGLFLGALVGRHLGLDGSCRRSVGGLGRPPCRRPAGAGCNRADACRRSQGRIAARRRGASSRDLGRPRARLSLRHPRQVRARAEMTDDPVERVSAAESEAYFATRPRGSQLAAWASQQSRSLPNREELERRYAELEREYEGREVPRPPHWGGFRLRPEAIEFWEHRENRLHDRIRYTRAREGWRHELLSP